MYFSQNGYSANDTSMTAVYTVPGTKVRLRIRKGDVATVLLYFAKRFSAEVENIDNHVQDDWGYAARVIRGGVELSNHASGTAIDLNATCHGLGEDPRKSFSGAQIAKIHALLRACKGVIRWGGDYTGRKDGMHFEVVGTRFEVASLAAQIRLGFKRAVTRTLRKGTRGEDVRAVQRRLITLGFLKKGQDDGFFGPATYAAVKRFKAKRKWLGVLHNGEVGGGTVRLLGGNLVWEGK